MEVGEGSFTLWFCFVVKTKYPTIAIVMPKEMMEKPIENVLSHEEFVLSMNEIIPQVEILRSAQSLFEQFHLSSRPSPKDAWRDLFQQTLGCIRFLDFARNDSFKHALRMITKLKVTLFCFRGIIVVYG